MLDSSFEGLNSVKKTIADVLLEKKNDTCRTTWKPGCICILTHKWELACKLIYSMVTISVFSTMISLRKSDAFWPTNKKPFATCLLDPNDSHFFDHDILEKLTWLFVTSRCNPYDDLIFCWSSNTRNASNVEKKKYQDNCTWPRRTGILQSSKTKVASSEEWMHDTMDWMKSS